MDLLNIIILAVVQGISEFLPISSSGHLVVLENFLPHGLDETKLFFFNLLVHMATLFATLWFYRKDILTLLINSIKELKILLFPPTKPSMDFNQKTNHLTQKFSALKTETNSALALSTSPTLIETNSLGSSQSSESLRYSATTLVGMLLITTVITGIIGIVLKPLVSNLHELTIIGGLFIINGLILLSSRLRPSNQHQLTDKKISGSLNPVHSAITFAVILGITQGLAVFPGISRSGTTITTALLLGLVDREAMKYSILCSMPIITGAFLLEFIDFISTPTSVSESINYLYYIVAFITSLGVGYGALHILYRIVKRQRIYLFSYYVFTIGLSIIIYSLII